MIRCLFLLLIGLAWTLGAGERPNVLFLFSDDQRADTIAALGNKHLATPNLDSLIARGTAFTRAYCMGSMQGAVCVPSRAMLMSGRTLFRVNEHLKNQATWPEAFAKAGYRTFITGKWHNGRESVTRAFQQGRAVFLGGMTDPYTVNVADFEKDGKWSPPQKAGKHAVELFSDHAVDFLKRQKAGEPFLCYVAFTLPHDPRKAPPEYHAKFDGAKIPLPANFLPQHPFNNGEMTVRDERLAPWPRTAETVQKHLGDYYASVEFMDAQIGRILEALKASGQYENTIIVFSSDHGLSIGSHGLFGKQNLYDHSMRAPLIFAGPGIAAGKQRDAMAYLLDIFPTLGQLCNVDGPDGNEGKSLVAAMAGSPHRSEILTAYTKVQRAVRDSRWKLIVYPQINKTQLFDLEKDPHETDDLGGKAAFAGELARMRALLERQQKQFGDEQPLSSENPKPADFDFSKAK